MNDVMVDIETLSTDSNAVIVSISAVHCNMETGEIGECFEIGLDLNEQLNNGGVIDGETVMWWLAQCKGAQDQLTKIYRHPVGVALADFNTFIERCNCNGLWGNGATFDNVIIRNLYKRHGIEFKAQYWSDRCVRTRVADLKIDTRDYKFIGTKHNGLDDCIHQINYCTGGLHDRG